MNREIHKERFIGYFQSLLDRYGISKKTIADRLNVSQQYLSNITAGKLPGEKGFMRLVNALRPEVTCENDLFRLNNLFENAKYGRDLTVNTPEDQQQLLPLEDHFLSLFRGMSPEAQIKTLEHMVAWNNDHK